jgi:predicted nucleic acid-binding protein
VLNLRNKHVILDNNIIFDFGSLDDFDLLNNILKDSIAVMSPIVHEETKEDIEIEKLRYEVVVYSTAIDYTTHLRLRKTHRGLTDEDISCLVLARKYEGICTSNDKLIRKIAVKEGIDIIGSIGLLKCAVAEEIITHQQGVTILKKMTENGAFIENRFLDNF